MAGGIGRAKSSARRRQALSAEDLDTERHSAPGAPASRAPGESPRRMKTKLVTMNIGTMNIGKTNTGKTNTGKMNWER